MKEKIMNRRTLGRFLTAALSLALLASAPLVRAAADEAPDALIKRVSSDVLETIKSDKAIQSGEISRVAALVDTKVMPNVNFQRMTASAVGRYWRQATPEQQRRLQDEFKLLLLRTYSGALTQVREQTTVQLKPTRSAADAAEMVVRTEVRGSGDPIQLDYRLEKSTGGWKIYDVNVLGVWLVENYRNTFQQEVSKGGIDGLIKALTEKNRSLATSSSRHKS